MSRKLRILILQLVPVAHFEIVKLETWRERVTEERIRFGSGTNRDGSLPHIPRDYKLWMLALEYIRADDHDFAAPVRVEQQHFQRVSSIKMPNFIGHQFVHGGEILHGLHRIDRGGSHATGFVTGRQTIRIQHILAAISDSEPRTLCRNL